MWENLTPVVCSLISDFRPLTPDFLLYALCSMLSAAFRLARPPASPVSQAHAVSSLCPLPSAFRNLKSAIFLRSLPRPDSNKIQRKNS